MAVLMALIVWKVWREVFVGHVLFFGIMAVGHCCKGILGEGIFYTMGGNEGLAADRLLLVTQSISGGRKYIR